MVKGKVCLKILFLLIHLLVLQLVLVMKMAFTIETLLPQCYLRLRLQKGIG